MNASLLKNAANHETGWQDELIVHLPVLDIGGVRLTGFLTENLIFDMSLLNQALSIIRIGQRLAGSVSGLCD